MDDCASHEHVAGLADNMRRTIMLGKSLEGHTGMDLSISNPRTHPYNYHP